MSDDEQGERSGVAPVIPLFGGTTGGARPRRSAPRDEATGSERGAGRARRFPVRRVPAPEPTESEATGAGSDGDESGADDAGAGAEREAPRRSAPAAERWHTTWRDLGRERSAPRPAPEFDTVRRDGVRFIETPGHAGEQETPDDAEPPGEQSEGAATAERALLRSLGRRGLSVSEARQKLRAQDVPSDEVEEILDRLERSGALDDEALAEQLVHAATTRRNEGRRAIAQALAKRGIRREVADREIAELPDDDAERALEYARSKAPQLARLDGDTALRRLAGQLARRGYGGLALSVAAQALDEQRTQGRGVRFE